MVLGGLLFSKKWFVRTLDLLTWLLHLTVFALRCMLSVYMVFSTILINPPLTIHFHCLPTIQKSFLEPKFLQQPTLMKFLMVLEIQIEIVPAFFGLQWYMYRSDLYLFMVNFSQVLLRYLWVSCRALILEYCARLQETHGYMKFL